MKSFTSIVFLAASAASVSAQATFDSNTGTFSCPVPNGAYCAGNSLETNIIIRCVDGVGHPGNCNDNLAGQFPQGVNFAPCWEPSVTSGQAACSKNCVVYGSSGNFNGTFTLPDCTPEVQPTSSVPISTVTATSSALSNTTTAASGGATTTTFSTLTSCSKPIMPTGYPTAPGPVVPSASGTGGLGYGTNGTSPGATGSGSGSGSGSGNTATATPHGPTATQSSPPSFTGAAAVNAGTYLAGLGLFVAYLL